MLTIGLCGGSGTGKNTVADAFLAAGIPVIDADAVYHEMVDRPSPLTAALAARFGDGILRPDGALDRVALRRIVFGDKDEAKAAKADLDRLTHGEVLRVLRERLAAIAEGGALMAVVNAPLLLESGFDRECDFVVAVLAERRLRLRRLAARDGLTEEEAAARIGAQLGDDILSRRADAVLINNGTVAELLYETNRLIQHIRTIAEERSNGN